MSTIVITDEVSYQVGVDILGFPIYHQHLFATEYHTEDTTQKRGKNMTKHTQKHTQTDFVFSNTIKQF